MGCVHCVHYVHYAHDDVPQVWEEDVSDGLNTCERCVREIVTSLDGDAPFPYDGTSRRVACCCTPPYSATLHLSALWPTSIVSTDAPLCWVCHLPGLVARGNRNGACNAGAEGVHACEILLGVMASHEKDGAFVTLPMTGEDHEVRAKWA
jgi:hypothetical protein